MLVYETGTSVVEAEKSNISPGYTPSGKGHGRTDVPLFNSDGGPAPASRFRVASVYLIGPN